MLHLDLFIQFFIIFLQLFFTDLYYDITAYHTSLQLKAFFMLLIRPLISSSLPCLVIFFFFEKDRV